MKLPALLSALVLTCAGVSGLALSVVAVKTPKPLEAAPPVARENGRATSDIFHGRV